MFFQVVKSSTAVVQGAVRSCKLVSCHGQKWFLFIYFLKEMCFISKFHEKTADNFSKIYM